MRELIKRNSEHIKKFALYITVAFLILLTYGAFLFAVLRSDTVLALFAFVALSLSSLSLALSIWMWVLVKAKMLSTHSTHFVDLKTALGRKKESIKNPSMVDPFNVDEVEEFAERTVKNLFGKENLTDNLA